MLSNEVSNTPAPFLSQLSRVRGSYDAVIGVLRQMPRRIQNAPISALGRPWGHEHRETINVARRYLLQLLNQELVMRCGLKAAVTAPLS